MRAVAAGLAAVLAACSGAGEDGVARDPSRCSDGAAFPGAAPARHAVAITVRNDAASDRYIASDGGDRCSLYTIAALDG